MKKLMAMIGAVAMSFGLFADDATPTPFSISFEAAESEKGVSDGAFNPNADGVTGWTWAGDPLSLAQYVDEALPYGLGDKARRDAMFTSNDNFNYLPLETGTDELVRSVGTDNLYLDQLVKFTGFEDPQTNLVAGTKIAIWMSEFENEDESTTTNLYVTVGKVDALGAVEKIALTVAPITGSDGYELNTWYRLTIKSLGNIIAAGGTRAGFLIYINGQKVASSDDVAAELVSENELTPAAKKYMLQKQLFTAIDDLNATFASVGYQGIGAVDDVILDANGPAFCVETETVDVRFADITGAIIAKVVDSEGTEFTDFTSAISVKPGALTVTLEAAEGYKWIGSGTYAANTGDAVEGVITIDAEDDFVEVYATKNGTVKYGADELYTMITGLVNGDVVLFNKGATINDGDGDIYDFTENTTIDVTVDEDAVTWDVAVSNTTDGVGAFSDYVGVDAGNTLNVWFEAEEDAIMSLYANVAGTLKVEVGALSVESPIEVAGTITAATLYANEAITLSGSGKVITMTDPDDLTDMILDGDSQAVEPTENDPEDGWYTYALSEEPTGKIELAFTSLPDDTEVTLVEGETVEYDDVKDLWKAEEGDELTITLTADEGYVFNVAGDTTTTVEATAAASIDLSAAPAPFEAVAKVNDGTSDFFYADSAAALAKVQALEAAETFPIVATALVADLAVVGPNGVTIVLAKDETITITANSWVFSGGATISDGPIALAAGATFTVVEQIANYKTVFTAPTDYEVIETANGDGTYTYSAAQSGPAVAQIGTTTYPTLGAAIAALTGAEGETIELLMDYTAADDEVLKFTKSATLDLGKFELTLPTALLGAKAFEVADGAEVSFENGTITMGDNAYGLQVYGAATVSCTMTKLVNTTQGPIFDIYGQGTTSANGGIVTVVDGASIESGADVFRHKKPAAKASVFVTGGTLKAPVTGNYCIFNGSSYLSADDVAVITGGKFLGKFEQTEKWGGMTLLGADAADARFDDTAIVTATARLATGYEFAEAEEEGLWKVVKIPSFDVTFTVDEEEIQDSATNVLRDTVLTVDMIPDVSSLAGAWDVDPVGAIITETTNFNFTTVKYVTITLPQDLPDGVTGLVVSQSVDGVEWTLVEGNQIVKDNQYVVVATAAEGYTIANPIKSGTASAAIEVTSTDFEGKITPPAAKVAKIGTVEYPTLADAVAAAALAGEAVKIELLDNVTENVTISGVAGELDLGDFTLTSTISVTDSTLTISNGTIDYGTGTFTVNSGTVTLAADATMTGAGSAEPINVKGGTFNIYGTINDCHTGDSFVIVLKSGATVNAYAGCSITGGSSVFKPKCEGGKAYLNIYGGTFTCNHPSDVNIYGVFYGTKDGDTTEIKIAGGTFVVNGGGKCMFYDCSDMIIKDADGEAGLDDTCTATFNINPLGGVTEVTEEKLCKSGYTVEQSAEDNLWRIVKAAADWPETWPQDVSDDMKAAFATWAEGKSELDFTQKAVQDAFLMNSEVGSVPELKIESISVEGTTATIVVSATGKNLETDINGVLYIDAANDLTNWTTTEVETTADFTDGKATFTVNAAKFMKAGVGFKAPVVE